MESNTFNTIEEHIATDGKIECKRNNPMLHIVFFVVAVALFAVALAMQENDGLQMTLLSIGVIVGFVSLIMLVLNFTGKLYHYRYTPTGSDMKKYQRYIDSADRAKCREAISSGSMGGLSSLQSVSTGSAMLYAVVAKDSTFALVQYLEYVPHSFVPASQVMELDKQQTAQLLAFLKA